MRRLRSTAMLAVLVLAIAACGGADGPDEAAEGMPEATSDPTTTETTESEDVTLPGDEPGADLDDGVAAVVNGHAITAAEVEQQVEALSGAPEVAEALDGPEGEQTLSLLRAQVVSSLIINRVVVDGADELGAPVTDADIDEARGELEAETGGPEGLQTAMGEEGMTEDQLVSQLRAVAALRNIERALAEQGDGDPDESGTRAQQYISELLAQARVVVATAYGTWDPQTGEVAPVGVVPVAPEEPAS